MLSVDLTYDAAVSGCEFCPLQFQSLGQKAVGGSPLIAYDTLALYLFVRSQFGVGLIYDAVEKRDCLGETRLPWGQLPAVCRPVLLVHSPGPSGADGRNRG